MKFLNVRASIGMLVGASALLLNGCFGNGPILNPSNINFATLAVSPLPVSLATGATQTFTATTTNAGGAPVTWALDSVGASAGGVGTLSASSGNTVTYTAPLTPPTYPSGSTGYFPNPMPGHVLMTAQVQPTNGAVQATVNVDFFITAPTVSVGVAPVTASVALGATQQFGGYSVGSATQGITWQVNGVTGGSLSYGTISQSPFYPYGGMYTAPATMPVTGPLVPITVVSVADPTKTQTAIVTLH